jgi:5-methylthioadenosine/S-adenosylhomocysteine deaminase
VTLILRGRYAIRDWREKPIEDGAVLVDSGRVKETGDFAALAAAHPGASVIGSRGHIVMPGLVNAHTHGRGLPAINLGVPDDHLELWLLDYLAERPLDVYLDTLYADLRLIRTGVTTAVHSGYARVPGQLETETKEALRAHGDAGLRVAYAVGFEDRMAPVHGDVERFYAALPTAIAAKARAAFAPPSPADLDRVFAFIGELAHRSSNRLHILHSPSWTAWCSDNLMARAAQAAREAGTGLHLHALESPFEPEAARRRWGTSTLAALERLGVLGPRTSLAHGVWLSEDEIAIAARTGTTICHCPSSNLRLRNGIAPVRAMLNGGVRVGLGMDSWPLGGDENLFDELRLAHVLSRLPSGPRLEDGPDAASLLSMATTGAAAATTFDGIGTLNPGAPADAILLDYDAMTAPRVDADVSLANAVLHMARPAHVDTVMIGGEVVLRGGQFTKVDEADITRHLAAIAKQPRPPAETEFVSLTRALRPFVKAHHQDWPSTETPAFYGVNRR